jgi:predicted secreted Zn-dependent protease
MSIFSGTADDIVQKYLVRTHSLTTYKRYVTLNVKIKLSPCLRELKTDGDLQKIFTHLLAQNK